MAKKSETPKIENIRHSLAHLLAASVLKKFPKAKLGIGPVIENGFYYDFLLNADSRGLNPEQSRHGGIYGAGADKRGKEAITPEDLPEIEKEMRRLIKENLEFTGKKVTPIEAKKIFSAKGGSASGGKDQPFKLELIKELQKNKELIGVYRTGDVFVDLCRGPHVKNTNEINPDAFKLDRIAGAYWKGDEKNPQLQRVYGLAFNTKEELNKYLEMIKEAEKRDHKKLGLGLDLFTFSEIVGGGLPLWTPKGTIVRNLLDDFVWRLREAKGYLQVDIPHLAKKELYEKSGHWEKFEDDLFKINSREGHLFVLKPMNCPHHTQIYNRRPWSYRDLPQRYASTTKVYRDEQTGELAGLVRVRAITQDDAHVFCRESQTKEEFKKIWDIVHEFYGAFGFKMRVRLSLHDPKHPEKYLGNPKRWKLAEDMLRQIAKEKKADAFDGIGEANFYGPKLDFMTKDSLGREWQVATIQLDMNMPERFDLVCTNEEGAPERIVMIHAAIMGSIERFLAVLIEHTAGAFPLWLAPVQVSILPVSEKFSRYSSKIFEKIRDLGIRVEISDANETLGKRIRDAEIQKNPYILVVGEKEKKNGTVNVRHYRRGQEGEISLSNLIEKIEKEIKNKVI